MKPLPTRSCAWLLFLLALFLPHHTRAAAEAEFLVEGDALTPTTTLEVRFARDMVTTEALGVPVAPAPLVVQPPLVGTFVWLSRRSGVLTPGQEPVMGQGYTISLQPGLRDLAGRPVEANLQRTLTTPPFQIISSPNAEPDRNLDPQPKELLQFNREVKLEGAEGLFSFVDEDGHTIPAKVQYRGLTRYLRTHEKDLPWETQWAATQGAGSAPVVSEEELENDTEEEPARYALQVEPQQLLAADHTWRLAMKPGLQALTGNYTLARAESFPLGRVKPFTIEKVTSSSYLNSGRSIAVTFSREWSEALKEATAAKYITVVPEVRNLQFQVGYHEVSLHGDFARDVDYQVEFGAELRDLYGMALSGERTKTVRFGTIKPRVYFPAVDGHQMLHGQRTVKVTSINMRALRVQAQMIPAEKTVQALARFQQQYQRVEPNQDENERYHAVATKALPGAKTYEKTIALSAPALDTRQETTLDWNTLLGGPKPGMVLLTVEGQPAAETLGQRAGAQTLVQLTDLGVLWKKVGDALQVTVFSMATGQPVEGASVAVTTSQFVDEKSPPLLGSGPSTKTAAGGAASLVPPADTAWLTVRKADDVFTMRLGQEAEELPMSAFRLPIEYGSWEPQGAKGETRRALLFTERPLYRPGETAHLKGILRAVGREGLRYVAKLKGVLTLFHPREQGTDQIPIQTDEHGAFHADLPLAKGVVGTYRVGLSLGAKEEEGDEEEPAESEGFSTTFITADYQPNAFEVKVDMPARLNPGAEVAAAVSGRYFFGAPLGEAHARWTLQYSETAFAPEEFSDWEFGVSAHHEEKSLTLRGEGALPAGGSLPIRPRLPDSTGSPRSGVLTVEVTDQNQQTITEKHEFTRDSSSFYLGMKVTEGYTIGSTESIGAMAIALRPDGTPLPEPLAVKAELIRVFYDTVRVQSAGPAISFHTERREEVVKTAEGRTLVPVRAVSQWALPAGETARFLPGQGGDYLLRVSAPDGPGRTVATEYAFTVSGNEPVAWDYRHPSQVEIVADKAVYHPGEAARLLIKTPIAGTAMVTVERGDQILRTLRVPLQGNAPTIDIPIVTGDGPNVFVSLILIRGAEQSTHKVKTPEYRYGVCRLAVTDPRTKLTVKVEPRVAKVEPGQEIVAEVSVHEANGQPAAGAEISFAAVDDGVLALTGYSRPEPLPIFEKPLPLRIRTGLSLFDLLPEVAETTPDGIAAAGLFNKGYLIGGGGLGGKGPALRTDFPGTAFWQPKLKANADGRVTVKFKAPDALTSYRLVAVAYAGTDRFGSAESKVQISKRLILLSGLGPFAHLGDQLTARAVVRNESAVAGTALVSLELDGTAEKPAQPLSASIPLGPGTAANIDFPVRLRATGTARWKWRAQMEVGAEALEDGLVSTLQVVSPAPILHETYLPELQAARTNLLEGVNPQLLEGSGTVQVTVANTRLASLQETSRALLEYPYGCAEQTVSSMIPWLVAHDFGGILPELSTPAQAADALAQGLQRLERMKVAESGIGYWPGHRAELFASAYAALALALVERQTGAAPAMLEDVMKFLKEGLKGMGDRSNHTAPDDYALALYALATAGQAETPYEELLLQRRAELTRGGRALLACALLEGKPAPRLIEQLLDERTAAPEDFSWFGSGTRERALRLLAWTRFRPRDREVTRLTQELLAARRNGQWRNTQENAWSLLALSRYFAAVEGSLQPVSGMVQHGTATAPFALTAKRLTSRQQYDFGPTAALETLAVANPQKGPLYGEVKFTVEPPVALQPRQDRGYGITRSYFKIDEAGKLQPVGNLVVGDRVVVVLQLTTAVPGHFVAIDDPLPSILEAVNPEFRSQEVGGAAGGNHSDRADYQEVRADRVLYFCDHLPPGTHTFQYLARVRAAGQVLAPSTKAEEMYRPERFGLGAGAKLESKAR